MDRLEGEAPAALPVESVDPIAREIAHVVESVCTGKQPLVDVVEGARAVAVCLAAVRSARERQPVTVDYSFLS
jgi:predicted dehydrogenase